ncbi:MAG: carbohydrate kinase family protein [Nanoarchaeota archaeon]|nr:carbohydrate kinase family protein [Nanoarchaeota archaeon]
MYDVISVGSSTVDVFAHVQSELIKIKTASYQQDLIAYPCGSKILIDGLEFLPGGGGTNTAVAFSKLGLRAGYLGKVGSDANSGMILDALKKEKVDFLGVKEKGISGYSIILDSIEHDRTILAYKGVNDLFDFDEIKKAKLKTKWFYFSSMVGKSYESLEKLAVYAKAGNAEIAFNPSNYLASKGKHYLMEVLSRTDLLVLNKEESMLLVGKGEIATLLSELSKLGPKRVVITDGKDGAYTCDERYVYHVIPPSVDVIETTGAGDAFASTFLAGTIKKKGIVECLQMGCINSVSVISNRGAKEGLLSLRSIAQRLLRNPPKIEKKSLN